MTLRRKVRLAAGRVARRIGLLAAGAVFVYLAACLAGLVLLRWVDPVTSAVQIQRRLESIFDNSPYTKRSQFVPLDRISPHLRHAVIAAEDSRFYQHHGIDWHEIGKMVRTELPRGRIRGASTITQQLVKNLFLTTHRNPLRKPLEFLLAPAAEWILGKRRILELYLNLVEWGPGIYGAQAAARYHYHTTAATLDREQAARLAAILPSPRRWRPQRMDDYSAELLARMGRMGW